MSQPPIDLNRLFSPVATIEGWLQDFADDPGIQLPRNLIEAIRYALLSGGKRLRALLAWYWCEAAGAPGEECRPAAIALELVHAFSLVHDDLPALDNDDLRRGKPSLHKHAGEAMAILAGDAMLNLAYSVLANVPANLQRRLVYWLSTSTNAMIMGQVHDTLGGLPPELTPCEQLEYIHRKKTGALIVAACVMGYWCGRYWRLRTGSKPEHGAARAALYGIPIGHMFQVVDDLLDVTQTTEQLGKRSAKDAAAGKRTYPAVLGIDGTRAEIARLEAKALRAIKGFGDEAQSLRDLCRYMAARTR